MDFLGLRILVIDDQAFVRKVLRQYLNNRGCRDVIEAANGQQALECLAGPIPDAIVCDINMEPGNGFEFLSSLRNAGGPLSQIPFVFLTSSADADFVRQAKEMNVDGYLLKPVSAEKLCAAVERVIIRHWKK